MGTSAPNFQGLKKSSLIMRHKKFIPKAVSSFVRGSWYNHNSLTR